MYRIFDWIAQNRRWAIIVAIFLVFLLSLGTWFVLSGSNTAIKIDRKKPLQGSADEFKLSWWVIDAEGNNSQALQETVSKFKAKYPRTDIEIKNKKSELNFIEEFLSNPDTQPDIMTIETKNMSFFQKYSSPNQYFKTELLANYLESSVDSVKNNNVFSGEVFGVPLYVDNLQMYVNKNLLSNIQGAKTPAKDWETLKIQAASFDVSKGQSLIALGSSSEVVQNFKDIFGAMMLQKSIYLDQRNKNITEEDIIKVLADYNYFKQFLTRSDNDYDAFKQGKSLYYIDYFSANAKLKAENPLLDFEITDIPKYSNGNNLSHAKFYSTMGHKNRELLPAKKQVIDDFIYFLSTEDVQRTYAKATDYPSANVKVVTEQYKSKSDIDNNRRFFDQALVARSILPSCNVKYNEVLTNLVLAIQSKGISPSSEDIRTVFTSYKSDLLESIYSQNVCLPYKLTK